MKTVLSGILYFIVAFSSLFILNPGVNINAIFTTSLIATIVTLLLFWAVILISKKRQQIEKS
ncbi:hypothetical protein CLV99_2040 [Sphingobacterium yanglingense]|uniref:Uncharacterized protein n=1 Tax=Sphingobacterium yanglingense TaxID=1437280 RepID=A0A4R6WE95_9SPHI|nr:hypothetical protein CLV99_2040 [Sphingobacterium yanglingense]